jgi:NADP-dependent 3-hydroxy acid dehydrogenase YdfG
MQNSSGIKDKVVVITGASSGIGEATALLLAERGAKVVLGARGPDRLEALAARITASGGEVAYARTDVKRREDVSNLVGLAIERYGNSTAGLQIIPTMAVYAGTKNAVRTITETLRQEAGAKLRVTGISPGFVQTNLTTSMSDPGVKAQIAERMQKMAIPPAAIARAIAFAIEQPAEVDVNEIVIRPTAQT